MNDGKEVEVASHKVMTCILCYDDAINIPNPKTKERKGLITCYKTYGINNFKKHVNANHFIIAKFFEEEINNEIIGSVEKHMQRKGQMFQQM